MRPNIRIEIQNNLIEPMEVDEEQEEGEIQEDDTEEVSNTSSKQSKNNQDNSDNLKKPPSNFTTGINLFEKEELEKLQKRAERFQLKPEEIKNFTDDDLHLLYKSLGISEKNEANVKFEAILMNGLDEMTAEDILDYFLKYAPVSIEWINDESCNVVWSDKLSAARALHFISRPVNGMPVRDDVKYFEGVQEPEPETGESIFNNGNRQVELQEDLEIFEKPNYGNAVDISEIQGSIPPGFWRLGNEHPKSKCILLRFSFKTDLQPFRIEQLSRYLKKQTKKFNKTIDGERGIFSRNKEMSGVSDDNPWSVLAMNWDEDANFREKERLPQPEEAKVEVKSHSLKVRLGSKRKESDDSDSEKSQEMKKVKIPRMRMYADEEEEKIKRKKLLTTINKTINKISQDEVDLRRVLSSTNRKPTVKVEEPEPFDLGSTLKSRKKKMVFEVKTEDRDGEKRTLKENHSARSSDRRTSSRSYRKSPERDYYRSRRSYRSRSRHRSDDDLDYTYLRDNKKPRSKVAVVIKTPKKPSVASMVGSTVWSRINRHSSPSSSESESSDSKSSSSSSEESEEEEEEEMEEVSPSIVNVKQTTERPGFSDSSSRKLENRAPLKIEISNDHFNKKK